MLTKGPGNEDAEQEAFEQNDREHVLRAAPYGARRLGFEITLNTRVTLRPLLLAGPLRPRAPIATPALLVMRLPPIRDRSPCQAGCPWPPAPPRG